MFSRITNIQKLINKHFQDEIKILKEITEKEKLISIKKLELKEQNIKSSNNNSKNVISISVKKISEEIEHNKNIIKEKQDLHSKLIIQRSVIKNMINGKNNQFEENILNDNYQYYILILKNIILESKKFTDMIEIKFKNLELNLLTEEIKLKDSIIENTKKEIKLKNNTDFVLKLNSLSISQNLEKGESNKDIKINSYKNLKSVSKSLNINKKEKLKINSNPNIKDKFNNLLKNNSENFDNNKNQEKINVSLLDKNYLNKSNIFFNNKFS